MAVFTTASCTILNLVGFVVVVVVCFVFPVPHALERKFSASWLFYLEPSKIEYTIQKSSRVNKYGL